MTKKHLIMKPQPLPVTFGQEAMEKISSISNHQLSSKARIYFTGKGDRGGKIEFLISCKKVFTPKDVGVKFPKDAKVLAGKYFLAERDGFAFIIYLQHKPHYANSFFYPVTSIEFDALVGSLGE